MELKDQVCTLEQAKRLKELGVGQDGYFSWASDIVHGVIIRPIRAYTINSTDRPFYAAFTASELGEILPSESGIIAWDVHYNDHIGAWYCTIRDLVKWEGGGEIPPIAYESEGDTMAECMADALIHCLENKLLTPHS